jgi:hypothetical protein
MIRAGIQEVKDCDLNPVRDVASQIVAYLDSENARAILMVDMIHARMTADEY